MNATLQCKTVQDTKNLNPLRFKLGTTLSQPTWSIVNFPAKLGLKIDTFLTLMGTNLVPDCYSWVMESCRNYFKTPPFFLQWLTNLNITNREKELRNGRVCNRDALRKTRLLYVKNPISFLDMKDITDSNN